MSPTDHPFVVLLAVALLAGLVVGFLKTSLGGGIGLVLTPTVTLVLPAPSSSAPARLSTAWPMS